jgi:L-ascorbate metabolism protein UlaG (beta-lactamase superfamily)
MGVEDAIKAAEFVGCDRILGVHYDTFPPIEIDRQAARQTFRAAGKELVLLEAGQPHVF